MKLTPKYDVERAFPVYRTDGGGIEAVYMGADRWLVTAFDLHGVKRIEWQIMQRGAAECLARCWARTYGVPFVGLFR